MSIERTHRILSALRTILDMPVGEGWLTPVEIVKWSGVSHSTTYRYLAKMIKLGYVRQHFYVLRGLKCSVYQITDSGLAWFDGRKVMF